MKRLIVVVNDDLNTDQRVLRISGTLEELGFDVFLLGRVNPTSKPLNIRFKAKRVKVLANKGMLAYLLFNWRVFLFLMFNKFDVVLSNDLDTLVGVSLAARLKFKPIAYDSHEYYTELPELVARRAKQRIWLTAEKLFVPYVKTSYTVCQSLADIYSAKYNRSFGVVRNLPYRIELPSVVEKRDVIIYQGALNLGRGIELMIKSMAYLPDCELWIAGSGDVEQDLRHQASEQTLGGRVVFLGRLSPDELRQKTRLAKVGLSIEEDLGLNYHYALPNKLFDYIQARIPVIVADLPEMRRIVQTYRVGEIFVERTAENLAKMIRRVMDNADLYHDALEAAASQLCWENEKLKLNDLYRDLL